jgi:amidophosphoribosyltransferase
VLLNVLAHEIQEATSGYTLDTDAVFKAVAAVHRRVRGAYAVVAQIAGHGLLAFRDPYGIRPLCIGVNETEHGTEYLVASESVALEGMGFRFVRDIAPGEAVFIDDDGKLFERQCADNPSLNPCAFEFVYLARPDSVIDGASVYAARLKLGELLAGQVRSEIDAAAIDVVMPVDDISRPAAIQLALRLGVKYREGFIQNRYRGRSFDLPAGATRRAPGLRLNAIAAEFKGRRVLLVEDAIVDGASSREIVQLARSAGAHYVALASTAPPVLQPKAYGVDWPARRKPAALGSTREEMRSAVTADALVFQTLPALKDAIASASPALKQLETSCFDAPQANP